MSLICECASVRCAPMRNTFALAFVCALGLVGACAWGEGAPSDDDDGSTSDSDDSSSGDDSTPTLPVCGDGTCASSEVGSCSSDCGASAVCGNGTCEGGESNASCSSDCPLSAVCGDGTCDTAGGEDSGTCPGDCSGSTGGQCPSDQTVCFLCLLDPSFCMGVDQATCESCLGGGGGGLGDIGCTGGAPDGTCDADEDASICPTDCQ